MGKPKKAKTTMKNKISKIARCRYRLSQVYKGRKEKTVGGLRKNDLVKNENGKVVSKKASARGQQNKFMKAVKEARKALKIKGFQAVGGRTPEGQALLKKSRSLYKKK